MLFYEGKGKRHVSYLMLPHHDPLRTTYLEVLVILSWDDCDDCMQLGRALLT
jgi:hypothetical protein